MLVSDSYTESYNNESFLIIPLKSEGFRKVSSKIRSDLNFPLQFLLMVKDSSGNIRRADIAVFYPKSNICQSLPSNFFKTFFEEQKLTIDGTLSLIGLKNQNIFEMTFKDGKPSEFKDWQERIAPVPSLVNPIDGAPECTDWYLVITTYWEDGTYSVAEIYLYTHCTGSGGGGGGGGGGGAPPPPTSSSIYVTVSDGRQGANGYMNFTAKAHYILTGLKYPSPNSNIFTGQSYEGIFTTWPFSMHLPGTPWEITTSDASQSAILQNNGKEAFCFFYITINFPSGNYYGPIEIGGTQTATRFYASTLL